MKTFRITNVSNVATQTRGFFLDLGKENGDKHVGVGKTLILSAERYEHLPACVQDWAKRGWARVVDLDQNAVVGGPGVDGELTPSMINPVREMNGEDQLDEEPDIADAHEAVLPNMEGTGPINQSSRQMASSNTKVSQAMAEERVNGDLSPLPGEKPREIDNMSDFTVRAPRSRESGGIIRGSNK